MTVPMTPGTYEFRLYLNNGYVRVATSPPITVTQGPNPVPVLSALSPSRAVVGAPSTIAVIGTGFVASSVVQWNGTALPTIFTFGLPWSIAAIALQPTVAVAASYLGVYFGLRVAMTWLIGVWGLKQKLPLKKYLLIPAWDALAFGIWLASFARSTIMWRNREYRIRNGELIPVAGATVAD